MKRRAGESKRRLFFDSELLGECLGEGGVVGGVEVGGGGRTDGYSKQFWSFLL